MRSAFMNYYKLMIKNINMKQTLSANITASRLMILNTLQINLNVVITQAQLLILHNNFNLLIRDLLNEICQLVINLQQHSQNITHLFKSSNFTLSDNNMLNANDINQISILNAHVSVIIITLKSQSLNKYDRSVVNDHV